MSRQNYGSVNDASSNNFNTQKLITMAATKNCLDRCERSTKLGICCCFVTTIICGAGGALALQTPWGALTGSCGPILGGSCKYCSTIFDENRETVNNNNDEQYAQSAPSAQAMN